MSNGYAYINTRDGKHIRFELEEKSDGYYFAEQRVAPLRNWMQAELRAKEVFAKIRNQYIAEGNYLESYSSIWYEPNKSGQTYEFAKRRPKDMTPLRNYGTKPSMLEFQVRKNMALVKGQYQFDQSYYQIQWRPRDGGNEIQIQKNTYRKDGSEKSEALSPWISESNKQGVAAIVAKFKKLYRELQR